jgi:hypothetical protein
MGRAGKEVFWDDRLHAKGEPGFFPCHLEIARTFLEVSLVCTPSKDRDEQTT